MKEQELPFKITHLKGAALKSWIRAAKERKLRELVAGMRKIPGQLAGWDINPTLNTETLKLRLSVRVPLTVKKQVWCRAYAWLHKCATMVCDWQEREEVSKDVLVMRLALWSPGMTWPEKAAWLRSQTGEDVDPDTLRRRVAREKSRWRRENPIERIDYVVGAERYPIKAAKRNSDGKTWAITFENSLVTEPPRGGHIEVVRGRRKYSAPRLKRTRRDPHRPGSNLDP